MILLNCVCQFKIVYAVILFSFWFYTILDIFTRYYYNLELFYFAIHDFCTFI